MPAYQIRNGNQLFDTAGRMVGIRTPNGADQFFDLTPIALASSDPTRAARRLAHKLDALKGPSARVRLWSNGATVQPFEPMRLSTGQLLIAVQAAAATTGASEPTLTAGAAPAAITDNGVTWWPLQELSRAAPADAPSVTITDNAGGSARTLYNIVNNASLFEQGSAPNLFIVAGSGLTARNIAWVVDEGTATDYGAGAGKLTAYRTISFITTEDVIDLGYFSTISTFTNERLIVEVDGYPSTEAPLIPGAFGASRHFKFTIAGGRRERHIRIRCYGGFNLQYIGIASDTTLRRPPVRSLVNVMLTDSFGSTEMPAVTDVHFDLAPRISRRIGYPSCAVATLGGTSYSVASASRRSVQTLLSTNDFSLFGADAFTFMHGYNAASNGVTPAVESAAALDCWTKVRAIAPNAPILVVGPHYRRPSFTAQVDAMTAALKAQLLAMADPNSAYIDPTDGSITLGDGTVVRAADTGWVNTTNASWVLPPAGGVFDGAHLSIAGRAVYEDAAVNALDTALNALGQ